MLSGFKSRPLLGPSFPYFSTKKLTKSITQSVMFLIVFGATTLSSDDRNSGKTDMSVRPFDASISFSIFFILGRSALSAYFSAPRLYNPLRCSLYSSRIFGKSATWDTLRNFSSASRKEKKNKLMDREKRRLQLFNSSVPNYLLVDFLKTNIPHLKTKSLHRKRRFLKKCYL